MPLGISDAGDLKASNGFQPQMTSAVRVTSSDSNPEAKGASYYGDVTEWLKVPDL